MTSLRLLVIECIECNFSMTISNPDQIPWGSATDGDELKPRFSVTCPACHTRTVLYRSDLATVVAARGVPEAS